MRVFESLTIDGCTHSKSPNYKGYMLYVLHTCGLPTYADLSPYVQFTPQFTPRALAMRFSSMHPLAMIRRQSRRRCPRPGR